MMAAMKMAVDDINAKRYIKFTSDSLLPNSVIKLAVRTNPVSITTAVAACIDLETNSFNGSGIDFAIGAVTNNMSQAMSSIFQDSDIGQIGYNPGDVIKSCDFKILVM